MMSMNILRTCVSVLLLALQAVSVPLSVNDVPRDLDQEMRDYLQKALSDFRQQMPVGFPEFDIPPMDPLSVRNKTFVVDVSMAHVSLHLPDATVEGLSNFVTDRFHVSVKNLLLDTHIRFEEILIRGHYAIDGLVAKILPLYGNGSFLVHSRHPSIALVLQLNVDFEDIDLRVRSLDIDWSSLSFDFENLVSGGEVSAMLHRLLPVVGKKIVVLANPQLVEFLEKALNDFFAEQVKKPSVQEMLQKIIEESALGG